MRRAEHQIITVWPAQHFQIGKYSGVKSTKNGAKNRLAATPITVVIVPVMCRSLMEPLKIPLLWDGGGRGTRGRRLFTCCRPRHDRAEKLITMDN